MKQAIRSSIFTNSTSKQKWSFPKSRRFLEIKNHTEAGYYSNNSSLSKKSTSFGVGQRKSLADYSKQTIDPGKYNIPSTFQKKNKGFSFGTGRDQTKFQNYLKMLSDSQAEFHTIDDSALNRGKSFSIKQRTQYPPSYFLPNDPQTQRRSKLPGPNTYQTIDNLGQKCVSSKKKNIGYHFSHGQRFFKMKTLQVGPGSYDDRTIRADGQYVLSNMRSSGKRTIFKGKRRSLFDKNSKIPGPGQYDIIGDFGQIVKNISPNITQSINIQKKLASRPQTARN